MDVGPSSSKNKFRLLIGSKIEEKCLSPQTKIESDGNLRAV